MTRSEFSAKTKVEAFARCGGRCEKCTAKLSTGNTEYDHEIPCGIGGDSNLRNCVVLCRNCHRAKTGAIDMPRIAKAKRNYQRNAGIRKPRSILGWRRFDGEPVRASRER